MPTRFKWYKRLWFHYQVQVGITTVGYLAFLCSQAPDKKHLFIATDYWQNKYTETSINQILWK